MEFQAVEYPNLQAFEGQHTAIANFAIAKGGVMDDWGYIQGVNGKVLCVVDERITDFPFNPNAIGTFNTNDSNYFQPKT